VRSESQWGRTIWRRENKDNYFETSQLDTLNPTQPKTLLRLLTLRVFSYYTSIFTELSEKIYTHK
jgi:hypothetical protein